VRLGYWEKQKALEFSKAFCFSRNRFAESQRIEAVLPNQFQLDVQHFWRNNVYWGGNRFVTVFEIAASNGHSLISILRVFFCLIGNENETAWLCHTNHFAYRFLLVVEKINSASVIYHIHAIVVEGQTLCVSLKQVGVHLLISFGRRR